ncbi:PTS sugar transporter subunit IIA [Niallia circulans]|uniref:PTS sugar transporter subunit IIA n=1 Tax=Niallia circulans TaxID=1397 RepID=A0A0J1IHS8_NIACI|nr:fructose PTS transporter subunit IIA [Niallia circulans]KLV25456.1 PTS sugar transporter subunit IIA [Niallia circulans]
MDISSMIDTNCILFDSTIQLKKDLFSRLATILEKSGYISSKKRFIKDLEKREKESPTGIEDGFGIPHAKSKTVKNPVIVFAHTGKIVDYVALDGSHVDCVFLLAVPEKASDIHLDILSYLARQLMNDDFKLELKQASNASDIQSLLMNKGGSSL